MRDTEGRVWRFEPDRRFAEFTPSHLREHMVQGLSVVVQYREQQDGSLHPIEIADYDTPTATP